MYDGYVEAGVSTHSRLKAAGTSPTFAVSAKDCFNTQPPEGGWEETDRRNEVEYTVSTHSRLKAAGQKVQDRAVTQTFQHTAA